MENICRFIPSPSSNDSINIINFVLETKPQVYTGLKSLSAYRMHLVVQGKALLHTPSQTRPLQKGDLFFVMPAVPYAIESAEGFQYLYISYLGTRANAVMDMLKVNSRNYLFHGFEALLDMWQQGLTVDPSVSGLRSESILLYTFSVLGGSLLCVEDKTGRSEETALQIKKYVDDNFSDPELSLEKISQELSYNPKYISTIFKSKFKMGFSEYLNTVRFQHAYVLIEQGFTSVKSIAALCGYKDPMYFSKVFRARIGRSPRSYISELENKLHQQHITGCTANDAQECVPLPDMENNHQRAGD